MKKIKLMILALCVAGSTMANGTSPEEPKTNTVFFKKVSENTFQLLYGSNPEGTVTVKFYDEKNQLIQRDRIFLDKAFAKYYDLSNLKASKYAVEVSENGQMVQRFNVNLAKKEEVSPVFARLVKMDHNQFKLFVNPIEKTDLNVQIYQNGRLIHEELEREAQGLHKLYKMENVGPQANLEFFLITADGKRKLLAAK